MPGLAFRSVGTAAPARRPATSAPSQPPPTLRDASSSQAQSPPWCQDLDALVFLLSVVASFVHSRLGTANLPGQVPKRPPASCRLCWLRLRELLRRLSK